jgi:hypothetical protein
MRPALPPVSSWYPGHMATFAKTLPSTLRGTHVVLEARDARMPLSSINTAFEDEIKKWQKERGVALAERIVVYTKSDLVPEWGMKVFISYLIVDVSAKRHLRDSASSCKGMETDFPRPAFCSGAQKTLGSGCFVHHCSARCHGRRCSCQTRR